MENEKLTIASILKSKAEMMADRNELFDLIRKEVEDLNRSIADEVKDLTIKIRSKISNEYVQDNYE